MTDIRERYEAAAALLREHGWNEACFDAIIGDLFPRLAPVLDELDRLRAAEEWARTQVSQSADAMQAMRESAIRDIVRLRGRLEVEVLQRADVQDALDDEREAHRHTIAAPTMVHGPLPKGRDGAVVVAMVSGIPTVMPWGGRQWGPGLRRPCPPSHVCTWAYLPQEGE